MLLHLTELQLRGLDQPVDVSLHPGEAYTPLALGVHCRKKVRIKEGIGSHGQRLEEKMVQIETNVADEDARGPCTDRGHHVTGTPYCHNVGALARLIKNRRIE